MTRIPEPAWDNSQTSVYKGGVPKTIIYAISVVVAIIIVTCTGLITVYFIKLDQGRRYQKF